MDELADPRADRAADELEVDHEKLQRVSQSSRRAHASAREHLEECSKAFDDPDLPDAAGYGTLFDAIAGVGLLAIVGCASLIAAIGVDHSSCESTLAATVSPPPSVVHLSSYHPIGHDMVPCGLQPRHRANKQYMAGVANAVTLVALSAASVRHDRLQTDCAAELRERQAAEKASAKKKALFTALATRCSARFSHLALHPIGP